MYVRTRTYVRMNSCMYVCMYICICMYVCVCICISVCLSVSHSVCMPVCMYACMYVCMYVFMSVCMYVCMCVYVCICICISKCLSVSLSVCIPACNIVCMHVTLQVCKYTSMYVHTKIYRDTLVRTYMHWGSWPVGLVFITLFFSVQSFWRTWSTQNHRVKNISIVQDRELWGGRERWWEGGRSDSWGYSNVFFSIRYSVFADILWYVYIRVHWIIFPQTFALCRGSFFEQYSCSTYDFEDIRSPVQYLWLTLVGIVNCVLKILIQPPGQVGASAGDNGSQRWRDATSFES